MFDSLIFTCVLRIQEVELGHLKSFLTSPSLSLVTFSYKDPGSPNFKYHVTLHTVGL